MLPSCSAESRTWKQLLYCTWKMEQDLLCISFFSDGTNLLSANTNTPMCVNTDVCVTQTNTNLFYRPSSHFAWELPGSCCFRSYCNKRPGPGAHLTPHKHTQRQQREASQLYSCVQPHSLHTLQPSAAGSGNVWKSAEFSESRKKWKRIISYF